MGLSDWVTLLEGLLWGKFLFVFLFLTGVTLSIKTRFISIRGLPQAFKLLFSPGSGKSGSLSPFQSLMVAMSATVGVGNIVGVATAVYLGGAGALFWMFLMGVFGMSVKYSEAYLAVKYRFHDEDGHTWGGPMAYIELGLGKQWRWLALVFGAFTILASFGYYAVQSNSAADALHRAFSIPTQVTGGVEALLVAIVVFGGIKRIGNFVGFLVPFMAAFYIICCVYIIYSHGGFRFAMFHAATIVVNDAFSLKGVAGGFLGFANAKAIQYGISRGLFSNEAGLGSAPMAHAVAQTDRPHHQGLVAMLGTFFDTVIVCMLTGAMLIESGAYKLQLNGYAMTEAAFSGPELSSWVVLVLSVMVAIFAFSTIVGWSFYMQTAVRYCFGKKAVAWSLGICVIIVYIGASLALQTVWDLSSLFNGLMALPNLIALLFLMKCIKLK